MFLLEPGLRVPPDLPPKGGPGRLVRLPSLGDEGGELSVLSELDTLAHGIGARKTPAHAPLPKAVRGELVRVAPPWRPGCGRPLPPQDVLRSESQAEGEERRAMA